MFTGSYLFVIILLYEEVIYANDTVAMPCMSTY